MSKDKKQFKLQVGETATLGSKDPIISITGTGIRTYLWVGNNHEFNKGCYATLSGVKTLETLACGILNSLGHNANSIKKNIYKKNKKP